MKVLIEIQGNKPLSSFGDNHVIAYNPNSKNYYVTTAETFFAGQNSKIEDILNKYTEINNRLKSIQEEQTNFVRIINENNNNFKIAQNERFENFLRQYQETNSKLIGMVKELVKGKEE